MPLKRLNPFIDRDGIIRLGGRVQQSKVRVFEDSPAIFPKHKVSQLVLDQHHRNLLHAGIQLTLYMARIQSNQNNGLFLHVMRLRMLSTAVWRVPATGLGRKFNLSVIFQLLESPRRGRSRILDLITRVLILFVQVQDVE